MSDGAYLFAVCGARNHLGRAVRAARRLRRFTERRIVIATDPRRNEVPLAWDDCVEVAIREIPLDSDPATVARAAILLKASVAELLPSDGPHVYLDSDVVAIAPGVDRIFDSFAPPVTFASDLPFPEANLRTFSSHAVDCVCARERRRLERFFRRLEALTALHRDHDEFRALADPGLYRSPAFTGERRRGSWWKGEASGGRSDGSIRFLQQFRDGAPVRIEYRFAGTPWRLVREQERSVWLDDEGGAWRWVEAPAPGQGGYWSDDADDSLRIVPAAGGEERWWYRSGEPARVWRADRERDAGGAWHDAAGGELGVCDHLREQLESLFDVAIADPLWVPWNGGLFLFDGEARPFLTDWRERCLRLFATVQAAPRDQGALVASVWAHRMESHPRLPAEFNRLIDRRSRRAQELRLATLVAEGTKFVHLIGGGLEDRSWPLGRDLADAGVDGGD